VARVGRGSKCCGSDPRCLTCPVRLAAELRAIETPLVPNVPEHLVGVPACLHKYEPLFRGAAQGQAHAGSGPSLTA
jgi:hypothetical protein